MARPPSHTVIAVHGHRYLIGGDEPDPALVRAVDAAVAKALQADPLPPAAVVWDAQTPGGERAIAFGEGLDDLLLSQIDASGCCAILEDSWRKLGSRVSGLGEALALLARDPTVRVARAEGVHGRVALKGAAQPAPGLRPKLVSVILLLDGPADPFEPFLDALAEQKGVALEVLALAAGLGAEDTRTLGARLDARIGPGNLRLRPFILRGKMSRAMLANTGVSLASGEVAVIAASACRPRSETTLRNLAAWAMGAETLSACPAITGASGELLSAGLTTEGSGMVLAPWRDAGLTGLTRRTVAPSPWFLAVNRAAWLALGGADPRGGALWSASLARAANPALRHLLAGSETVRWDSASPPPGLDELARVDALSREALRAVRLAPASVPAVAAPSAPAIAPTPDETDAVVSAAFSDLPGSAPQRLLVFADRYGASQAIAFVEGLRASRARGEVAVRIIDEGALGGDGPAFHADYARAVISAAFGEMRPTAVVLSRFGHGCAYPLIVQAAAARDVPVMAHIDDDLLEMPPCVGIERYRVARHPRRMLTLRRTLTESDLVLVSTEALGDKLSGLVGWPKLHVMANGCAGEPRPRPPVKSAEEPLIVGYMGSASHNHDLEMIAPALNAVLGRFDQVSIELFGSIAAQPAADLLRGRVRRRRPVAGDYRAFRETLGGLGWDIAVAPLQPIAYNLCKTATKWVEYAEAGAATLASANSVYAPMIEAGAAFPVVSGGWEACLSRLVVEPALRGEIIQAADGLLQRRYSWDRLEASVLAALSRLSQRELAA